MKYFRLIRSEGINAVTTVYRALDKLNKNGLFIASSR